MNFKIKCDALLSSLNIIQKALPSKTSMPILMGIKFDVYKDQIKITTCNGDITIETKLDGENVEIIQQGQFIVQGKYFIDIIRKINSKVIELYTHENNLLVIKAERSEFKLNTLTYEDYPELKFVNEKNKSIEPITLDSFNFRMSIKEIIFSTAINEKRPILTGVLLNCISNKLTCIATDSYRLSKKEIENVNTNDFKMVIPSKSLKELLGILEDYEGNINVYIDIAKVLFEFKNVKYETRLLEGNYPDTSRIVPTEFKVLTKFNRDEIMQAIERVSLLSPTDKDRNCNIVQFAITNNRTVEISSFNTEVGYAMEEIIPSDTITGPIIKVGFNSRHLLDAIKSLPSSDVSINFPGEQKPFIIYSEEYPNLVHVILPIKIL